MGELLELLVLTVLMTVGGLLASGGIKWVRDANSRLHQWGKFGTVIGWAVIGCSVIWMMGFVLLVGWVVLERFATGFYCETPGCRYD